MEPELLPRRGRRAPPVWNSYGRALPTDPPLVTQPSHHRLLREHRSVSSPAPRGGEAALTLEPLDGAASSVTRGGVRAAPLFGAELSTIPGRLAVPGTIGSTPLLGTTTSAISSLSSPAGGALHSQLSNWLAGLGLVSYEPLFRHRLGFTSLSELLRAPLSEARLVAAGLPAHAAAAVMRAHGGGGGGGGYGPPPPSPAPRGSPLGSGRRPPPRRTASTLSILQEYAAAAQEHRPPRISMLVSATSDTEDETESDSEAEETGGAGGQQLLGDGGLSDETESMSSEDGDGSVSTDLEELARFGHQSSLAQSQRQHTGAGGGNTSSWGGAATAAASLSALEQGKADALAFEAVLGGGGGGPELELEPEPEVGGGAHSGLRLRRMGRWVGSSASGRALWRKVRVVRWVMLAAAGPTVHHFNITGESFLRVHWVAVPQALRARRVNI
jgi:hypothetical protein